MYYCSNLIKTAFKVWCSKIRFKIGFPHSLYPTCTTHAYGFMTPTSFTAQQSSHILYLSLTMSSAHPTRLLKQTVCSHTKSVQIVENFNSALASVQQHN